MHWNSPFIKSCTITLLGCILCLTDLVAQKMHADNGDGTFTNPVISSDFPDIDLVRVGDTYYMLTTTMFIFPGVPLIKSKDLVNWEYCVNIVPRMDVSKCYNLDSCHRYSHGQWASSLKYHKGKFYVLYNTLDEGAFLCTATDPEGKWEIKRLGRGYHDCGLFFDDDGRIYVASGYGKIFMTELDENFKAISKDSLVFTGRMRGGLEGAHIYKLNGYYYLYCTYGGADGWQVALRSKNIWGPYEEKVVLRETDRKNINFGVHQGALVQTQTGEWWTMLFIDIGPFGRFPSLQPVAWVDDWPVAGIDGRAVVTYRKPDVGKKHPIKIMPTSDEFSSGKLGLQWGWNHNPDDSKWSFRDRKGHLRLKTATVTTDLKKALNSLTQRTWTYYTDSVASTAIAKFDVRKMKDGDVAGFAVFQDPYASIAVKKDGGAYRLVMAINGAGVDSVPFRSNIVYLMAQPDYGSSRASFGYSTDGKTYSKLGGELRMRFNLSIFTGNKYMLFNYATGSLGGYVDVDWFRVDPTIPYLPAEGKLIVKQ
jgi:beta-xylosidase